MNQAIATAIVKAQRAFGPALKTKANPHLKSKYADLGAVVDAVIDALHDNGIALLQHTHPCPDGVIVETILLHESGESYSSGQLRIPSPKADPQGYGSALTYARRYSLMATCGLTPEDDDGHAARQDPFAKDAFDVATAENIEHLDRVWERLGKEYTDRKDREGYKAIRDAVRARRVELTPAQS